MNVTKCPNGHFYDSDRFGSVCPQCAANNQKDAELTMSLKAGGAAEATVPVQQNPGMISGADPTVPVSNVYTAMPEDQKTEVLTDNPLFWNGVGAEKEEKKPSNIQWKAEEEKTVGVTPWDQSADENKEAVVPEKDVVPVVGWLICIKGNNIGRDYRLVSGRNFVGRGNDMDVCLKGDMSVSRNSHAIIVYDPKSNIFLAQPGTSKELFYINGDLVLSPIKLNAYDRISIGETELVFAPLCGSEFEWNKIVNG